MEMYFTIQSLRQKSVVGTVGTSSTALKMTFTSLPSQSNRLWNSLPPLGLHTVEAMKLVANLLIVS